MDVLRKLGRSVGPEGILLDTQPVSRRPLVCGAQGALGRLDMTAWGRTIEQIDRRVRLAIQDGVFTMALRRRLAVTDIFESGAELLAEASGWAGTTIERPLAARLARERDQVQVRQQVSLRVLQAGR